MENSCMVLSQRGQWYSLRWASAPASLPPTPSSFPTSSVELRKISIINTFELTNTLTLWLPALKEENIYYYVALLTSQTLWQTRRQTNGQTDGQTQAPTICALPAVGLVLQLLSHGYRQLLPTDWTLPQPPQVMVHGGSGSRSGCGLVLQTGDNREQLARFSGTAGKGGAGLYGIGTCVLPLFDWSSIHIWKLLLHIVKCGISVQKMRSVLIFTIRTENKMIDNHSK